MKKFILIIISLFLSACAHMPKCGNPDGAKIILVGERTCEVRIRQVTIGSELKIPASLKGPGLANFTLEWVESDLQGGQIDLGHFVLVPSSTETAVKP